jgi:DNA-directed RNA polymerase I subunit RPA1
VKIVPNKAIRRALGIKRKKKRDGSVVEEQREKRDPVLSQYSPSCYLGAVSEKFELALRNYISVCEPFYRSKQSLKRLLMKSFYFCFQSNPEKFSKTPNKHQLDPDVFRFMMYLKYMHSLVQPGEAVGVLAGQVDQKSNLKIENIW